VENYFDGFEAKTREGEPGRCRLDGGKEGVTWRFGSATPEHGRAIDDDERCIIARRGGDRRWRLGMMGICGPAQG
jgi:hypothetical protein